MEDRCRPEFSKPYPTFKMSNIPSEYQPVTLKDEIREEGVVCKDEMPEVVGDDWMQVLLEAAQRYSRKRIRKAYPDRVRENWHDYDRVVYDYYGYEEEMMKQKEVEKKLQLYQLQEIWKNKLRESMGNDLIDREMVAMAEKQDRLEATERSSRKRNLKIYMDRVSENWHDRLVCDYYGYEEDRMKQEEDEMKYKEVQGAFKRTKHATDGSYTTNSSTGSRAEEPSQSCTIGQKGNKRAPEDDSVEEDVRTKTIHLDRFNEVKFMMIDYNILTRDTSSIPKDQLAIHLKVCKKIKRRKGMM